MDKNDCIDSPIVGVVVKALNRFEDRRGWLSECYRQDELPQGVLPAMLYVSQTFPEVARGPHEHVHQTDVFIFMGPGTFRVYLWDARKDSATFGQRMRFDVGADAPTEVVVPPGVVHAYKCISDVPGIVLNAPDKLYAGWGKTEPVDEIRHESIENSPYVLD